MPETERSSISQITFRPLTDDDRPLLEKWWQQDEDHRDYSPEYFRVPNTTNLMFCDEDGPVFVASVRPMIRVGIQFDHTRSDRDREKRRRTARAMEYFLGWIESGARQQKLTEIIYSSVSPDLIAFVEKKAGYFHSNDEYRKKLYVTTPPATGNATIIPTTEDADARSTQ
jgi:hypothetical protein